jgi:glycosyltransferase involved in cell wall biosynthesis
LPRNFKTPLIVSTTNRNRERTPVAGVTTDHQPPGPSWQLVIDAQGVQGPFNERGIARTVSAVSRALIDVGAPVSAVLLNPHHSLPPRWHASLRDLPLRWATTDAVRDLLRGPPIVWLMLSPMEGSLPDESIVPEFVAAGRAAIVPLIHDAIPFDDVLRYQQRHADARMHQYRLPLLRQAAHILAVSQHSANDWSRLVFTLPSVTVIGSAPTPSSSAPLSPGDATAHARRTVTGLDRPFVVYVGGGDERKNVHGALTAWAKLETDIHRQFQLVIVGSAPSATRAAWHDTVEHLGLPARAVLFAGLVDDGSLDALHQAAHLSFFPSLSEGFGMPVVEALAWGTPVICSNSTSLPEVIGWEPGMFDPHDPDDMTRVLRQALLDETFRAELTRHGDDARLRHTWPAVAGRIRNALEVHVVPTLSTRNVGARPSCAIIASDGSVDGWGVSLARALAPRADVDIFAPGADHFPIESFGRTKDPGRYSLRVFVLGDDIDGAAAFSLAQRFPGVLVLTTDRLTNMAVTAAGNTLGSVLHHAYDTRLPAIVSSDPAPSASLLTHHDIRLLAPVVQPAHELFAPNQTIADAAALDVGPWHKAVPVEVVATPSDVAARLIARIEAAQ